MITVGRDGAVWRWLNRVPGMTWSSRESFATLSDAVEAAKSVAECKGETYVEPEIEIWEQIVPQDYGMIDTLPECPEEYTEEIDAESAEQFMYSVEWAGALV